MKERREAGTGGIWFCDGWWIASIRLRTGKYVRRKRWTREDAEAALDEILDANEGQLGYHYDQPRQYRHGRSFPSPRTKGRRVRFQVLARDGFRCRYCGAGPNDDQLVVDHVQALADGGADDIENMVTACRTCNAGKADKSLSQAGREAIGLA